MWAYIVRRLLYNIPVFLGIILFMMLALSVSDPVSGQLSKGATEAEREIIEKKLGLDQPFYRQYLNFLGDLATLNFDVKSWDKETETVSQMLADAVPPSLAITIPSLLLTSLLAISIALVSAYFRGRVADRVLVFLAVLGMSVSYLVYIIIGQYVGAHMPRTFEEPMNVFAISGYEPTIVENSFLPMFSVFVGQSGWMQLGLLALFLGSVTALLQTSTKPRRLIALAVLVGTGFYFRSLVSAEAPGAVDPATVVASFHSWREFCLLPVLINVTVALGYDTRYYRAVMVEQSTQDYITTAVAKGATKPKIMFVHMLKNAMIPIITRVMITLPFLMTGSILLEVFFQIPGMGQTLITAINAADFPVIRIFTALFAAIFIFTNILTDILYAIVDPRVRLQ